MNRFRGRAFGISMMLVGLLIHPRVGFGALSVQNVIHEPAAFEPDRGETVRLRFHLLQPAQVEAHWYDGRDKRIRTVSSESILTSGEHELIWDGRDFKGRRVPDEAYTYTLELSAENEESVTWDIADATGGERFALTNLHYDEKTQNVKYGLSRSARVRIRAGIENGPLVRTIVDWAARPAGTHREVWNGQDEDSVWAIDTHPLFQLGSVALALPKNSVIVGDHPSSVQLIPDLPASSPVRTQSQKKFHRVFDFSKIPIEDRRDFPIQLHIEPRTEKSPTGARILNGPVDVQIRVAAEEQTRILNQRFEAVFYIDGKIIFENMVGFLPVTWRWDPAGTDAGDHILSANLQSFDGFVGTQSIRVHIPQQ